MKSTIGLISMCVVVALSAQVVGSPLWGPVFVYQRPIDAMVDITNDLGIAVLQDHVSSRSNFAFSPYGVASVLVLLYEGARGESARQIHTALRFPWQRDVTRIGFRDIHRHLRTYFSHEGYLSGITLSKHNTSLLPEYQRVLRFYGYDVSLANHLKPHKPFTRPPVMESPSENATETANTTTNSTEASSTTNQGDPTNTDGTTEGLTTETKETTTTAGVAETTKGMITVEVTEVKETTTTAGVAETTTEVVQKTEIPIVVTEEMSTLPEITSSSTERTETKTEYSIVMSSSTSERPEEEDTDMSGLDDASPESVTMRERENHSEEPVNPGDPVEKLDEGTTIIPDTSDSSPVSENTGDVPETVMNSSETPEKVTEDNLPNRIGGEDSNTPEEGTSTVVSVDVLTPATGVAMATEQTSPSSVVESTSSMTTIQAAVEETNESTDTAAVTENQTPQSLEDVSTDVPEVTSIESSTNSKEVESENLESTSPISLPDTSTSDTEEQSKEPETTTTTTTTSTVKPLTQNPEENKSTTTKKPQNENSEQIHFPTKDEPAHNLPIFPKPSNKTTADLLSAIGTTETSRTEDEIHKPNRTNNKASPKSDAVLNDDETSNDNDAESRAEEESKTEETGIATTESVVATDSTSANPETEEDTESFDVTTRFEDTETFKATMEPPEEEELTTVKNEEAVEEVKPTEETKTETEGGDGATLPLAAMEVKTVMETTNEDEAGSKPAVRRKRALRDPASVDYPDISLQLQNGMYNSHVSRNDALFTQLPRVPFLVDGVTDELVPVMSYTSEFPFAFIPRLHSLALEFPLDDERYKLLIILPVERRGLRQLIYDLSSCPLREVYEALKPTRVHAVIPSFMVEGFVILTSTLQQMGIWDVFDPRRSDLSGMSNDPELYVRNIEQSITVVIRNYVEIVDIQTRTMAARSETERFEATHPFLYFVIDSETHVSLMAGKIIDPLNSRIY